jgi:DNA-binding MarR family transcriptional regulator
MKTESVKCLTRFILFNAMIFLLFNGYVIPAEKNIEERTKLEYSFSGSSKLGGEFKKIMVHPQVQQVLLDIAESPRTAEYLESVLENTNVKLNDLLHLQLVRQEGERFELSFVLYTREDMDMIRSVAEEMGKLLAEGILARRTDIEKTIKSDLPSAVDWHETALFIIGCVSLDWDGLRISREKGYLTQPKRGEYIPQAIQPGGGGSNRALYWGSHNYHSQIAITSFGDHFTVRQALPDINWRMKVDAPEPLNKSLIDAARGLIRLGVGRIMIALREEDLSVSELSRKVDLPRDEIERLVNLLEDVQYIVEVNGKYRAIITVLTNRDRKKVNQLRQIGEKVILNWFDEHYSDLNQKLADLTYVKFGIPLADGFYEIWHYIFGIANRELVEAGLFADPYDPNRRYQGCIPAVYLLDVVNDRL